jgi:hypothetical protein
VLLLDRLLLWIRSPIRHWSVGHVHTVAGAHGCIDVVGNVSVRDGRHEAHQAPGLANLAPLDGLQNDQENVMGVIFRVFPRRAASRQPRCRSLTDDAIEILSCRSVAALDATYQDCRLLRQHAGAPLLPGASLPAVSVRVLTA